MWECAISQCDFDSADVEELLVHQAEAHDRHQCAICGTVIPDGYFAIRHAFSEHTRAEYLRNYDADTDDIRLREEVLKEIEAEADVESVIERIGENPAEA